MAAKTGTQRLTQQNVHLSPKEITGEKNVSSLYQDISGPGTSKRCQEIVSTDEESTKMTSALTIISV